MRRLVGAVLAALPFDPRSRRALDETLLDWAHEEASTVSVALGAVACVRSLVAVARAFIAAVSWETTHVPFGWLVPRMAVSAGVPAAAFMWVSYRGIAELRSLAPPLTGVELSALLVPHELEVLLPLAFFVTVAWSGRLRPSALGLAVVAAVVTLMFCLWLAPMASSRFVSLANFLWQPGHPRSRYGTSGRELGEIARAMRDWAHLAFGFLAFKIGLAALAGALTWLACVAPFRGSVGRRAGLAVAALAVYLGALKLVTGGYVPNYYYATESAPVTWCMWSVTIAVVVLCARATRRRRWLLLAPVFIGMMALVLPDDWLYLYRALGSGIAPWWMAAIAVVTAVKLGRTAVSADLEAGSAASGVPA